MPMVVTNGRSPTLARRALVHHGRRWEENHLRVKPSHGSQARELRSLPDKPGWDGVEQVTTAATFDGFPMFSPDGRKLVWASNRHDANPHETNVFIADW